MEVQASQCSWFLVIPFVLPLAMVKKTKKERFYCTWKKQDDGEGYQQKCSSLLFFFSLGLDFFSQLDCIQLLLPMLPFR
jgi:hypothetical protein